MNIKDIKKNITDLFCKELLDLGFEKCRRGECFKYFDWGYISADLRFWSNRGALNFVCSIGGKITDLEALINEFIVDVLNRHKEDVFTFGGNLGNIKSGVYRSWQIYNESEIEPEFNEMMEIFKQFGVPFIDDCSRLNGIYSKLTDEKKGSLICPLSTYRIRRILGLTYLLNRRDWFFEKKTELQKLVDINSQCGEEEFELFCNWLESKFNR